MGRTAHFSRGASEACPQCGLPDLRTQTSPPSADLRSQPGNQDQAQRFTADYKAKEASGFYGKDSTR